MWLEIHRHGIYAPHLTNPRLPDDAGTILVRYPVLFEFLRCCTIFFGHDEFVFNSMAKGSHDLEVLAKVEVLDVVVRAGRLFL